ncbi:hypothetical protein RFI_31419 [Reticulomyxa filosa]|uniref:Uncharacterized protein n=1 Tax=Reticulomyxa filosa TaxID=46433 RepID=X6LVM2_RETFI|nr:hypothetical protein RFI_31419 [Reticulomyxa filosa]|eukprot:ETO05973.1 hypothetical protein RFI_31419 [Reticulomyxa filosa]
MYKKLCLNQTRKVLFRSSLAIILSRHDQSTFVISSILKSNVRLNQRSAETPLICQNSVTKYGFDKVLKTYLPQHTKIADIAATLLSEEQEQKQLLRVQQHQQQYECEHEHAHEHEEPEEDKEEKEHKYHYSAFVQNGDIANDLCHSGYPIKSTQNCNPTCLPHFKKHLQFFF